LLILIMLKTIR